MFRLHSLSLSLPTNISDAMRMTTELTECSDDFEVEICKET